MKKFLTLFISVFIFNFTATAQWYLQISGTKVNLNSIFFIKESTGWACGDSGKILKTTNSGAEWIEQNSNTTEQLKAIHFVDQDNGWAYSFNKILRTTNGGLSWEIRDTLFSIVGLQFVNLNTGWLVYQIIDLVSFIDKTTDGGSTWTTKLQSPDGDYKAMFFLDESYGWVTKIFDGAIIKTTDGGNGWLQHDGNFSGAPMCIRFVDSMTGWVSHNTLGSYAISKSTDGGDTWFVQKEESFKFINSISFSNPSIGYAAGFGMLPPPNLDQGFILKTTNGGTDWLQQFRQEGELNSIFFINDTIGWAAGNDGKILATENGGILSINEDDQYNPNEFILHQNFPNPFNPSTKIKFTIPASPLSFGEGQGVRLIVYDILGNEIATLVNEEKPAGTYEVEFDASNLPSGIYFYQLKAGNFIQTKKMILLK